MPAIPSLISGPTTNLCTVTAYTYSIAAVSGATSYVWSAPTGTTIVSGQGTTTVLVSFSGAFVAGNITVKSQNPCGISLARTLALSSAPPAPAAIYGVVTNVCPGTNQTYTITSVTGAQSYIWSIPSGATIVSGQGTTSISVSFNASFVSGTVNVQTVGSCSNSINRSLSIYKATAPPGIITGAISNVCGLSGKTYSITSVSGASSYLWTVPVGATIVAGQGTKSITVNYASIVTAGNVSVVAVGTCANSAARNLAIAGCNAGARTTDTTPTNEVTSKNNKLVTKLRFQIQNLYSY